MPLKIVFKNFDNCFSWVKILKNDVNSQEMLYNKISENPQKGFFTIARSGDEQN